MKISIKELKSGFDKIFNNLLDNGIEDIEIHLDYYWNIDESDRYNVEKDPSVFDIGQLSDDYLELQKINSGAAEPIPFSLVWLSALARAIGENKVVI